MNTGNNRFKSRTEAQAYLRTLGVPRREVHPTATIEHAELGKNVGIGPYTVIGKEGFGFDPESNFTRRWVHLGRVLIGDDVEIGAHVCIDRGVLGDTIIGESVKLDNFVHISHNCVIGSNCLLAAGTVIGGSCVIGSNVFVGLNATVKDHVTVGRNVVIGCGATITRDVPDNTTVYDKPLRVIRPVNLKTDPLPIRRLT